MIENEVFLLKKEIESWKPFENSLREEDREIFRELIRKCWRYSTAIESSEKEYLIEPFFLTILLIQQRAINQLQSQLDQFKEEIKKV